MTGGRVWRARRSPDGLQAWCRDCRRNISVPTRHSGAERHREAQRRYRLRHTERTSRTASSGAQSGVPDHRAVWCQRCGCVTELEAHHHDYSSRSRSNGSARPATGSPTAATRRHAGLTAVPALPTGSTPRRSGAHRRSGDAAGRDYLGGSALDTAVSALCNSSSRAHRRMVRSFPANAADLRDRTRARILPSAGCAARVRHSIPARATVRTAGNSATRSLVAHRCHVDGIIAAAPGCWASAFNALGMQDDERQELARDLAKGVVVLSVYASQIASTRPIWARSRHLRQSRALHRHQQGHRRAAPRTGAVRRSARPTHDDRAVRILRRRMQDLLPRIARPVFPRVPDVPVGGTLLGAPA